MNLNERFRLENEIVEIKKQYSPPVCLQNFIDINIIQKFIHIHSNMPKKLMTDAYRNSFRESDDDKIFQDISIWTKKQFQSKLGDFGVSSIIFYESPTPASATDSTVHADLWDDENIVDKTILIPLIIEPDINTFTIIFEQHYYHYGAAYIGKVGNKQTFGPTVILPKNYNKIDKFKQNTFINKEIYHKYLTHKSYSNFYGLSVCDIIKWQIGDAIIFNRTHLHCCDHYFDIKKRAWLSIWTYKNKAI